MPGQGGRAHACIVCELWPYICVPIAWLSWMLYVYRFSAPPMTETDNISSVGSMWRPVVGVGGVTVTSIGTRTDHLTVHMDVSRVSAAEFLTLPGDVRPNHVCAVVVSSDGEAIHEAELALRPRLHADDGTGHHRLLIVIIHASSEGDLAVDVPHAWLHDERHRSVTLCIKRQRRRRTGRAVCDWKGSQHLTARW